MKRIALLTLLLTAILAFSGIEGNAASVERLSLNEMAELAPTIVHGTVTDVSAAWNDEHTQVFTTVTVRVDESLKGRTESTITFKQLGGTVGDTRVSVHGFPVFRSGSEVVLFLSDDPYDRIATVGLGQGKFEVYADEATGEKKVANDILGLEMFDSGKLTEASSLSMDLSELKSNVKQALNRSNRVTD